jgi:outer membrane protein assembly factor BamB
MDTPTLEDRLRQATKHFTSRLPEDEVFRVGHRLGQALADAEGATPPRHPGIDPSRIVMNGDVPDLAQSPEVSSVREGLFELGALLFGLATGERPTVAWRLDAPEVPPLATLPRRAALRRLLSQRTDTRFETAREACEALGRAAQAEPSDAAAPWPMFRGGPERLAARTTPASPRTLQRRWDALVGSCVASPVATASFIIAVTADGRVVFLDRQSGRVAHVVPLGAAVESSPALLQGQLFVGTDAGEMVSIGLASGEVSARTKVGDVVRSSPLPLPEQVLVGTIEGREAGALVALAPGTLRVLWRRKLAAVFSSPTLAAGRVLVGSDNEQLSAVDLERGQLAWSTPLAGRVRATPAVAAGRAFVGTFAGRLVCLDAESGAIVWSREVGEPIYSSASISGDVVAVGCHDGAIHGFSKDDGSVRFRAQTRGPVVGSPVAAGDSFVVSSTDGGLYLVGQDGEMRGRGALPGTGGQSSAAIDGDFVFIGGPRGIHALGLVP